MEEIQKKYRVGTAWNPVHHTSWRSHKTIWSIYPNPKFNRSPLKSYLPNRKGIVFQSPFFQGRAVKLWRCISIEQFLNQMFLLVQHFFHEVYFAINYFRFVLRYWTLLALNKRKNSPRFLVVMVVPAAKRAASSSNITATAGSKYMSLRGYGLWTWFTQSRMSHEKKGLTFHWILVV